MMGNRTGALHPAHASHETYYAIQKDKHKGSNLLIIENVCEYEEQTIQQSLGPHWEVQSICLDPRLFGIPAARARRFAVCVRKAVLRWNNEFTLSQLLEAMTCKTVMSMNHFFWLKKPVECLHGFVVPQLIIWLFDRPPCQRVGCMSTL